MPTPRTLLATFGCLCLLTTALRAQVPQLIHHQGRVAVGTVNFQGTGQFRFALVNAAGTTTYWSNDGTSVGGAQPTAAVSLPVTKGLYSVLLGDTALANMTVVLASVFTNADVRLRVWFNDGTNGSQLLTPDQRLAPNGYLPDGAVGPAALAANDVTSAKIAAGAVTNTQLAAGSVQVANLAAGAASSANTPGYSRHARRQRILRRPDDRRPRGFQPLYHDGAKRGTAHAERHPPAAHLR
jgi:hypothetical protein